VKRLRRLPTSSLALSLAKAHVGLPLPTLGGHISIPGETIREINLQDAWAGSTGSVTPAGTMATVGSCVQALEATEQGSTLPRAQQRNSAIAQ